MQDSTPGMRIKMVRGKMSQPGFCKALESEDFTLTAQSLMNYEKGYRVPPMNLLMRIVDVFQVDRVWLFFGETESNEIIVPEWVPEDGTEFYGDMMKAMKNSSYIFYDMMRRWPRIKKSYTQAVKTVLKTG